MTLGIKSREIHTRTHRNDERKGQKTEARVKLKVRAT